MTRCLQEGVTGHKRRATSQEQHHPEKNRPRNYRTIRPGLSATPHRLRHTYSLVLIMGSQMVDCRRSLRIKMIFFGLWPTQSISGSVSFLQPLNVDSTVHHGEGNYDYPFKFQHDPPQQWQRVFSAYLPLTLNMHLEWSAGRCNLPLLLLALLDMCSRCKGWWPFC
jgi:hypothetical protein